MPSTEPETKASRTWADCDMYRAVVWVFLRNYIRNRLSTVSDWDFTGSTVLRRCPLPYSVAPSFPGSVVRCRSQEPFTLSPIAAWMRITLSWGIFRLAGSGYLVAGRAPRYCTMGIRVCRLCSRNLLRYARLPGCRQDRSIEERVCRGDSHPRAADHETPGGTDTTTDREGTPS